MQDDFEAYEIKVHSDKGWAISTSIMIGETHLDLSCQKIESPSAIKCDFQSRKQIKKIDGLNSFFFEKNNVFFWFEEREPGLYAIKGVTFKIKLVDEKVTNRDL